MKTLKEIAKEVRAELKKEFPGYKFSVVTKYASMMQELLVAVMCAPETPFANLDITTGQTHNGTYWQLNQFQLRRPGWQEDDGTYINNGCYLTEAGFCMLKKVDEICNRQNWDRSDYQTDYSNVNYYFSLSIGRHDRPFEVKK